VLEIVGNHRIITKNFGSATLTFHVSSKSGFAPSNPATKVIEVVPPSRKFWLENRRNDPRYSQVKERFVQRMLKFKPHLNRQSIESEFDLDQGDSDGDGFSNLYERALGMDSLASERPSSLVSSPPSTDGLNRITFIRFTDPQSTLGQNIKYIVEMSHDLRTWNEASVALENTIPIGGSRQRDTFVSSIQPSVSKPLFLRLKIISSD